ncbi:hypothetical protein BKA59DRAFT_457234 [Fusarium tricinctum]|uniref:Uncharacterized protein n=1 Tax=Fusarium tricinctum TaxID=61284 RepID=A0A8K0RWF1_9HYPO|nr:hypothetical protein BKA59DRAFT_457234 [Fusarium tricinctum]
MHYPSLLLATLLATLRRVSGECHRSGETWSGDKFTALEAAQRLCTDGSLAETDYGFGEFKTFCVNLSTLKKADFTVMVGRNVVGRRSMAVITGAGLRMKEWDLVLFGISQLIPVLASVPNLEMFLLVAAV